LPGQLRFLSVDDDISVDSKKPPTGQWDAGNRRLFTEQFVAAQLTKARFDLRLTAFE
jgi:hypothetical protein